MIFSNLNRVLVTGPHRAGTTIATEIIAEELGLPAVRESALAHPRFEGDDEPKLTVGDVNKMKKGVLQGATTYRWLPEIAGSFDAIVVVLRSEKDIIASQIRYRGKQIDRPESKYLRLSRMVLPVPVVWVSYEKLLSRHPRFVERETWITEETS